jgi:hypothetical protein
MKETIFSKDIIITYATPNENIRPMFLSLLFCRRFVSLDIITGVNDIAKDVRIERKIIV